MRPCRAPAKACACTRSDAESRSRWDEAAARALKRGENSRDYQSPIVLSESPDAVGQARKHRLGEMRGLHWRDPATSLQMKTCFFFQAEDGIRDLTVTGVQTCALPI